MDVASPASTDADSARYRGDERLERAAAVITAFLQDEPAPLPNYPTRADIPAFLRDHG